MTGILTRQPEPYLVQQWVDLTGELGYVWQETSGRDR